MCKGRIAGKVALVTGGARGIGKAICERLAQEGAELAIVDIMKEVAQATADEFCAKGVKAHAYAANVAKFEEAEAAVAAVVADFGHLDILVNNAGITKDNLMLRMTDAEFDAVIAVNLKGTYNFTKAAVKPMMKQRAGKIVNIASVVGRMGNVGQANYAAIVDCLLRSLLGRIIVVGAQLKVVHVVHILSEGQARIVNLELGVPCSKDERLDGFLAELLAHNLAEVLLEPPGEVAVGGLRGIYGMRIACLGRGEHNLAEKDCLARLHAFEGEGSRNLLLSFA